jgi:hypothetical protein
VKKIFVIYILFCIAAVSATAQHASEGKEMPPISADDLRRYGYPDDLPGSVRPSATGQPFVTTVLTPPEALFGHAATAFDRRESVFALALRMAMIPYGERETFIGMGRHDRAGVMLRWQLSERISLGGGGFAGRQYDYMLPGGQNVFGVRAALDWTVSDRLLFGLHGQYVNAVENPLLNHHSLFMNPYAGLFWEYEIRKNLTAGAGVGLEYDRIRRKWTPVAKVGAKYRF